jgi:hypothetical protein
MRFLFTVIEARVKGEENNPLSPGNVSARDSGEEIIDSRSSPGERLIHPFEKQIL